MAFDLVLSPDSYGGEQVWGLEAVALQPGAHFSVQRLGRRAAWQQDG
jgi:hypothetical protein